MSGLNSPGFSTRKNKDKTKNHFFALLYYGNEKTHTPFFLFFNHGFE